MAEERARYPTPAPLAPCEELHPVAEMPYACYPKREGQQPRTSGRKRSRRSVEYSLLIENEGFGGIEPFVGAVLHHIALRLETDLSLFQIITFIVAFFGRSHAQRET
ncbi:MAG: hypothetical protein H6619_03350 [Deltaproteobacteria bacterium]|nr:hypothetical protein [Deltaproteobacteria bacterium]